VLYPVVPLAQRQALGIAVMSYDGHLGFGLLGDYDALPDLDEIALDLEHAVRQLARAAHVPSATRSETSVNGKKPARTGKAKSPAKARPRAKAGKPAAGKAAPAKR
jgi:hypothetical protein